MFSFVIFFIPGAIFFLISAQASRVSILCKFSSVFFINRSDIRIHSCTGIEREIHMRAMRMTKKGKL